MVQLVNPAQNALDAFGQVKNIQYREDQEEFLKQKREDYKVDREFTLDERKRIAQERELQKQFQAIKFGMFDENGNLQGDLGNELVNHEALRDTFIKQASEITGRDDIEELRVIQADSELAEQYPDLQPGQIVPFGRTKDGKVIPLVDQETGEAFTMDSDEFAGVVTSAAAAAGQFDIAQSLVSARRDASQRESIADFGRSFKSDTVAAPAARAAAPQQTPAQAAQLEPGAGGQRSPAAAPPDGALTTDELNEEINDAEEEIRAIDEELARDNSTLDAVDVFDAGSRFGANSPVQQRAVEREERLKAARAQAESRLNAARQARDQGQSQATVRSEEQQLRETSAVNGAEARRIQAQLKQVRTNGSRFNANVGLQNEQIDRIARLAETGAIDAGAMFDMIDSIKNPDLNTTTTETDNWIITSDQRGNEIGRIAINPNGSGLSADEERKIRKDQLAQGRKVTDQLVSTLGLEEGSDRAKTVRRLSSNTTALLDPNVMNIDGVMQQAVDDMDAYIDNNDGIWAHVVDFFGGPEVPEAANQRDLMPFILARSMMPEGQNSPTTSSLDAMQDQVDLVRGSLKDAKLPGAAIERTAFSALAVLARQGASEAQINSATKRLAELIKTSPEEIQRAASTPSGALALAQRITSRQ